MENDLNLKGKKIMSNQKHTPGPWHINDMTLPSRRYVTIGNNIAHVLHNSRGKIYSIKQMEPEQAANARLIAAAPELLEALREMLPIVHAAMDNDDDDVIGKIAYRASAAIAKAEGE